MNRRHTTRRNRSVRYRLLQPRGDTGCRSIVADFSRKQAVSRPEPRGNHPQPVPDRPAPDYLNYETWLGPVPWRPFNPNRFRRWNSYRDYGNGEIGGDDKVLIYENRNFAPYKMHGWDNGNVFYGTQGYMVFSRRGYFQTYLGAKEEEGPGMRGGAGGEEHVRNFLDCVRSGKTTNADAGVAHLSCGVVHLGEIAYRTGRVLRFDPKSEQFPGDEEANALLTKKHRPPWAFSSWPCPATGAPGSPATGRRWPGRRPPVGRFSRRPPSARPVRRGWPSDPRQP